MALRTSRRLLDRAGGDARLEAASGRWAENWLRDPARDMAGWLGRAGAGAWWFEPLAPGAWAQASCTTADLELADRAVQGVFDLIGSGPVHLGEVPRWRRDLYSGIEWPLERSWTLGLRRHDGSDIRTVWELSRCYHFIALARAWHHSRQDHYAHAFASHVDSFIEQNPLGFGPHWASPMDVAIRAANWSVAAPLFAGAPVARAFWARFLAQLRTSGAFVRRHLEWHPAFRGNHYVANLVGLVYLGTLFRGTAEGDRWLGFAAPRLVRELEYQVGPDGVSFEGAIAYHRLVTELFAWAGELLRRNDAAFHADRYDRVLRRMGAFLATYLQPDGRAPMIGDADDGQLHALDAAAGPRDHGTGLPPDLALPAVADGAYAFPAGGFFVLRHGRDHAVIRCGPVGLKGAGSHDHNDQLGFELVVGGRRIISDSGTYAYTRDLAARYAFRATAAHSVVQLGDAEQNPIAVERPWRVLADRTRARALACEACAAGLRFQGEHSGYAHLSSGSVCRRELSRAADSAEWHLEDEITGQGEVDLRWRLHLAATEHTAPVSGGGRARLSCPGTPAVTITVEFPEGCHFEVVSGRASDAYGTWYARPVLLVAGKVKLPARIWCTIAAEQS